MDAPQVPSAPDSVIGQLAGGIVFAIATIGVIMSAIGRYFHKRAEAHPDDVRRSDTIELIDSAQVRNDLHTLAEHVKAIDAKQDTILDDLLHLKNENEIAKRTREEVARQLAQETRLRHRSLNE